MKNMCPFCQEVLNRSDNMIEKNRVIGETDTFIVFPTVGGFVDNYQLIVPKKHINCFGELTSNEWEELNLIIEWQRRINEQYFDSGTSMFEHGALLPNNESGKSIVHAHLHIFPNNYSLLGALQRYDFSIQEISDITELVDVCHHYETYLYYRDVDDKDYVFTHEEGLPSQFLRKVLADSLGVTGWNWREIPYIDKLEACLKFYEDNSDVLQQFMRR